jgi:hypothetical protein
MQEHNPVTVRMLDEAGTSVELHAAMPFMPMDDFIPE